MVYEERIEEIDLQRYWLVLKRRWRPASLVFGATVLAALGATTQQEALYEAGAKLLLRPDQTAALTGIENLNLGDLESLKQTSDPLATQAEIIFSLPILEDTIRVLDLKNSEGEAIKPSELADNLTVEPLPETDVIAVSYSSGQPDLSAAVVNQIMRSYIEANVSGNRSEVTAARRFLEEELPRAKAEADAVSEALRDFDTANNIIALPEEAGATVTAIAALDSQIQAAQVALVAAESQANQLSQQLGMSAQEALALASINQSPTVQASLTDLQTTQAELATARTQYTSAHPSVRALERKEAALRNALDNQVAQVSGGAARAEGRAGALNMSSIDEKLAEQLVQAEVDRVSNYNQLATLVATRDAYQANSGVFPALKKTQIELEQRQASAQSNYETLRSRLQEVKLAENRNVGNARIVEFAVPPELPKVESPIKYLLGGAVVGAFLGVATAFFLDLIDRTLKTVKDGEKIFGYTPLGVIPHFEMPRGYELPEDAAEEDGMPSHRIITLGSNYPILSGAYQMLQANLRFISSDEKLKVIALTSSTTREGKSEVCANLAAAVAQTNRRVLLVDADMRSPSQHHLWNLINAVGLSHVLVGEGSLERALQPVTENLTIMTAGVVPPNPMALLDSERMASLIELFREQFDYVIFDTPSLTGAADSAVLGSLSDGVLMVMRPRHVTYDRAIAAKSLLERSGANVLGMIANGVDSKNDFGEYSYDARELTDVASRTARVTKERLQNPPTKSVKAISRL